MFEIDENVHVRNEVDEVASKGQKHDFENLPSIEQLQVAVHLVYYFH